MREWLSILSVMFKPDLTVHLQANVFLVHLIHIPEICAF
jgi:hypothetical protein